MEKHRMSGAIAAFWHLFYWWALDGYDLIQCEYTLFKYISINIYMNNLYRINIDIPEIKFTFWFDCKFYWYPYIDAFLTWCAEFCSKCHYGDFIVSFLIYFNFNSSIYLIYQLYSHNNIYTNRIILYIYKYASAHHY